MSHPRPITRPSPRSIVKSEDSNIESSEIRLLKFDLERIKEQLRSQQQAEVDSTIKLQQENYQPKENLDFKRISWFVGGLIIGSTFNTTTVLVLVLCWIFVENKPLPLFLGGRLPLDILSTIISYIGSFFSRKKRDSKISGKYCYRETVVFPFIIKQA